MNDSIHELICEFKSAEAFWAAAKNVLTDKYSQKMFLNIANQRNHIVHLLKDIDKIQEAGISNTQQYKLAGNSIVVDVLEAIFKNLFGEE